MNTFAVVTIFIFFNTLSLSISFICVPIEERGGKKNVSQCVYVFRTDKTGIVACCHVFLRLLL